MAPLRPNPADVIAAFVALALALAPALAMFAPTSQAWSSFHGSPVSRAIPVTGGGGSVRRRTSYRGQGMSMRRHRTGARGECSKGGCTRTLISPPPPSPFRASPHLQWNLRHGSTVESATAERSAMHSLPRLRRPPRPAEAEVDQGKGRRCTPPSPGITTILSACSRPSTELR